ncbi:E3 ubiquitin-protein ligase RBBP6-like isoform X2 [Macrobrachium nipponense]|uniref:E3 ubiquitin-protein ligase RBBP6-like isoform X2 n=1 Tax=Macrobrachium nipponense TaxID=159736 RepID=UPI0030C80A55
MSDSDDDRPIPSMVSADSSDDDGPSTSWGLKRRSKCAIISDSENDDDDDDDDDLEEEVVKDGESGDSDSSDSTPGAKTCAICLGRMRGEVGSPDACEHTFCKFCLLEWAKNNATCPQDRIPFTSVLVRKVLGGPICKEVPIPKGPAPDVYEFVETENPTYCEVCNQCNREDRLLLCDGCDLGYHLECLNPPLTQVPVEEWFCPVCVAVDVPETLSHRLSSSSRRSERTRRSSSRSGNTHLDQQELRIPRTRATERIREQIQKKKRRKRRKQRGRKKAKISSGELEDTRPPVSQLERFRFFIEEDNDIDAEHTVDRYADKLLAGATHKSARLPAQRKAEAARHLRDVAFIPHTSYSGRVKNRVLEIVNIHSEETDNDLLSGILENQTIAFSSSKKLLLTNDRKLIKQPDANISCNVFQETDSLLLEPLPSQRKSPEKESLASCSNEGSSSEPCKELHKKEDSDGDKQSSSSERQRSPTRALHHSSSYKEKHGCSYEDKHSYKRASDWHKKDDHNKYTHNHSRYSHHDRHHSSRGNSSHYEPSCSYNSKDKSYVSSRWKEKRDHRGYHSKRESYEKYHSRDRSPHRRNRSPERENRRERRSPSSSIYKSHDRKSHISRSHNLHARSKGESSHSLGRSQWSFGYFNSNDSIITKNNCMVYKNNPITSGTEVQNNSKNIQDKSFSKESTMSRNLETFVHENGCHSSVDNLEQQNPSQGITCHGVSDAVEGQRQEESLSDVNDVSVSILGHCLNNEGEPNSEVELDKNCKEIVQKENSCSGSMMVPEDDKQDQKKNIINKIPDKDDYERTGKSSIKLPVFKKTKMSALFGEFEYGTTTNLETKECKVHTEYDGDLEEERVKYSKTSKKSKTELLFGNDSDSNSNPDEVLDYRHEIVKNKSGKTNPKGTGNNGGNSSHHKNVKSAISEHEAEEYDPVCGSMYHSFTINETEIKIKKSQENNKVIIGCADVNKLPTATAPTEKDFEGKDRVSWTKHVSEEKELKMEGDSQTKHSIKKLEVEEMEKFDKRRNEHFSRNNNGKDKEREQKNHIIGRKALENGAEGDKYVSRRESYSASHEKFGISEKELNPILGGKHTTKERKLKASDNDNYVNAKKESKSDLHKKHHTNSKESESQNHVNQRIRSDSYLSEIQSSKGKDSDLCGKVPSKGKEETLLKYNSNEEELDAVKKLPMKERELSESLDEKVKVKIPEKYKQTLSQLENLISKDNGTDFWEMPTFGNDYVIKVDNSKNNGVGRKSSSKGSLLFEKKNEEKGDCSAVKESEKTDNGLLSKCTDAKLEIDGTADFVLKIDKKKMKARQDFGKDKKQKDGHILNDLFGDIEDIGSSSCSNLPETAIEDQPQSARFNACPKESVKDGKMHISFEGKIMKPKGFHGDVTLGGCDSVVSMMDGKHTDNEADGKGLAMFRCTPVSKDKANSAVRNDAGSRIKVVKAECGDVIEPEKMHTLVLGYIKVYKHRQMKLHV